MSNYYNLFLISNSKGRTSNLVSVMEKRGIRFYPNPIIEEGSPIDRRSASDQPKTIGRFGAGMFALDVKTHERGSKEISELSLSENSLVALCSYLRDAGTSIVDFTLECAITLDAVIAVLALEMSIDALIAFLNNEPDLGDAVVVLAWGISTDVAHQLQVDGAKCQQRQEGMIFFRYFPGLEP